MENFKGSKVGVINDEVGFENARKTKERNITIDNKLHVGGKKYVINQDGKLKVNLKGSKLPLNIKVNEKGLSIGANSGGEKFGVNANLGIGKETSIFRATRTS